MHLLAKTLCVLALAVVPFAGCAEVTEECRGEAPVTVTVIEFPAGTGVGLEDVKLCETGTTNCVLTDDNGNATLCLPFDVETSFTRTKKDYGAYVAALLIPSNERVPHVGFSMAKDVRLATQYDNVMSPYLPRGTGGVIVATRVAGATFDLPTAAGEISFYADEELNWRLDLTATTTEGWGGFVELSPDVHEVELGGTAEGCIPLLGWPSGFENTVRFPVLEGHLTNVEVFCP